MPKPLGLAISVKKEPQWRRSTLAEEKQLEEDINEALNFHSFIFRMDKCIWHKFEEKCKTFGKGRTPKATLRLLVSLYIEQCEKREKEMLCKSSTQLKLKSKKT